MDKSSENHLNHRKNWTSCLFALVLLATMNNLLAEDNSNSNSEGQGTGREESHFTRTFGERSYPVFNLQQVIARLTSKVEDLIEKQQLKTSRQLKEGLDRKSASFKLARPRTKVLPSEQIFANTVNSIFLVAGMTKPAEDEDSWTTAFSTAFVVHEHGILSTSAHVFDHEDNDDGVVVMDRNGEVYPVLEVLASDRNSDTCLFRIAKRGLKALPLGHDRPPGTGISVIGHPGDSFFFFTAGHVSNYEYDDESACWMNITADFGQGSSGGPVIDNRGNVVGQVSRTYTLYAGNEARSRKRRILSRMNSEPETAEATTTDDANNERKKRADPQMVFKACTPVSAIRGIIAE